MRKWTYFFHIFRAHCAKVNLIIHTTIFFSEEFSSTSTSSTSETPKNSMTSSSSSSSSSSTESNEVMTTSSQLEVVLAEKENNNNNLLEETTIKNDECSNCLCNCNGKVQESSVVVAALPEVSLEVASNSDTALASSTTSGMVSEKNLQKSTIFGIMTDYWVRVLEVPLEKWGFSKLDKDFVFIYANLFGIFEEFSKWAGHAKLGKILKNLA